MAGKDVAGKDVAGKDEGPLAKPGDDPYEIEWPDDAKEMRAAEREKQAKRAAVKPAPRILTAAVLGITVVLLFIAPVTLALGDLRILADFTLPVVVGGLVLALPIGVMLERVTRNWRLGFPELTFLVVGIAVGAGWTNALLSLFETQLFTDPEDAAFIRSISSIFMGTAVASAFLAAKFWTDSLRRQPKWVYGLLIMISVMTVMSAVSIFILPPVA